MKKNKKSQNIILIIIVIIVLYIPIFGQIDENYDQNVDKAFAARTIFECNSSLKFCREVLKLVPNHPVINYLTARLNALLGNQDKAVKYLKKATNLGYTTKLPFNKIHHLNDSAFKILRKKKNFQDILRILKQIEKPVHKSEIAFIIDDKDLLPEGITYDPVGKMFYLGSETKQKIVKVDIEGKCTDFTKQGQDGSTVVYLGIHVDPVRRTLWVCMYDKTRRGVFKYDLSSGKLLKTYTEPPSSRCGFNDLVIHPNGDVYISDTTRSAIYKIPHSTGKLELFLKNKSFIGLNGITLSEDGLSIYIADYNIGIYKINLNTRSYSLLSTEAEFSDYGIDGLYCEEKKLYTVQICLNQVSRFSLNKDATHLEKCEIFERNGFYLHKPTTGVIVDDFFYFIADSQGKGDNPKGVIIMKTKIN